MNHVDADRDALFHLLLLSRRCDCVAAVGRLVGRTARRHPYSSVFRKENMDNAPEGEVLTLRLELPSFT